VSQIQGLSGGPSLSTSLDSITPELRLCIAIMRRAIWDFVLYADVDEDDNPEANALGCDAASWIFTDSGEDENERGRYTFCYICNVMELEASYVRRIILNLDPGSYRRVIRRNEV
jgi:hypothetical protein